MLDRDNPIDWYTSQLLNENVAEVCEQAKKELEYKLMTETGTYATVEWEDIYDTE